MATYGLLSTGFVPKTQPIIRSEIEARLRAALGNSVPLGDRSLLGQINGIYSEREALMWELLELIVSSQDPDAAFGAYLEAICALTGTTRDPARSSTVVLLLTGTVGTLVTAGSRAKTASTGQEFATAADATFIACTLWAASTAYAANQVRANAGRIYICTAAGTSAGSGGPTGTGTAITDGTVTWRYAGEGLGVIAVTSSAVNTGPIEAVAFDVNTIVTPVSGWQSVINLLDAELGAELESDASLRTKREEEIAAAGDSPIPAIRAKLLQVTGVTSATVFHNTSDVTDSDGVPPHYVEALVRGGDDTDIFEALFAAVAGGIGTYTRTSDSGIVTDDEGNDWTMAFSRPTEVPIYVDIVLVKDPSTYPTDGDAQVKAAIVAWGDARLTGDNVAASAILAQVFKVAGVLEVSMPEIGTSASPTLTTTITITSRQLATFDTSRITVTTSNGTP
jgi:uncharacterized phage protein gp47/JayE